MALLSESFQQQPALFRAQLRAAPAGARPSCGLGPAAGSHCPLVVTGRHSFASAELALTAVEGVVGRLVRNQNSDGMWVTAGKGGEGAFWGPGHLFHLDLDSGYPSVILCKNPSGCILELCAGNGCGS